MNRLWTLAGLAVVFGVVIGCGDTPAPAPAPQVKSGTPNVDYVPDAPAGIPITAPGDNAQKLKELVASKMFSSRIDPFALLGVEMSYERAQTAARLVQDQGFVNEYTPPEEKTTVEPEEPPPFRRLAGIVVSDGISALLELADGRVIVIFPGMLIPGTEWTVVSINESSCVVRRASNKRPKEAVINLQSGVNMPGQGGGNQGGGAGRPGAGSGDEGAAGAAGRGRGGGRGRPGAPGGGERDGE